MLRNLYKDMVKEEDVGIMSEDQRRMYHVWMADALQRSEIFRMHYGKGNVKFKYMTLRNINVSQKMKVLRYNWPSHLKFLSGILINTAKS